MFSKASLWSMGTLSALCAASAMADCPDPRPAILLQPTSINHVSVGMAIAADDDTVVLTDSNYGGAGSAGAVVIFRRHDNAWVEETLLSAPAGTGMFGDWLGLKGNRLVVSSFGRVGAIRAPILHVYERTEDAGGAAWVLRFSQGIPSAGAEHLCVDRPTDGAVRMSGGDILIVPGNVNCSNSSLYRFVQDPTLHLERQADVPIPHISYTGEPGANFDFKGDTAVVERNVYRRTNGTWALETQLPALSGPTREPRTIAVSLDSDGNTVALGNNWEPGTGLVGYVQVYRRTAEGVWVHEVTLEHPTQADPSNNPGFGYSVALLGNRLAVGAIHDDFAGPDAGAVFLYQRVDGVWQGRGSTGPTDAPGAWAGFNLQITPTRVIAAALGLDGIGGGVVFDACSIVGPGDPTPRCLPGALGLLTFIEAFFAADPFADFNRNGLVSVQDLFEYLAAWFAGCP